MIWFGFYFTSYVKLNLQISLHFYLSETKIKMRLSSSKPNHHSPFSLIDHLYGVQFELYVIFSLLSFIRVILFLLFSN
ncbi:hypothetical protein MtrunA17_Chr2g0313851 [Medicago truncatula]|uniref:Transmembrane protein n=1 Tax=Medicago truncatula TaxID=3880 RepID=A0A396JBT9_MEDTR|nr:hypothetical protein MtrunA17_Chr2g0313851 [Medicago truncatula]